MDRGHRDSLDPHERQDQAGFGYETIAHPVGGLSPDCHPTVTRVGSVEDSETESEKESQHDRPHDRPRDRPHELSRPVVPSVGKVGGWEGGKVGARAPEGVAQFVAPDLPGLLGSACGSAQKDARRLLDLDLDPLLKLLERFLESVADWMAATSIRTLRSAAWWRADRGPCRSVGSASGAFHACLKRYADP